MGIFENIETENTIKENELSLNTIYGSAKATFEEAEAMYKMVFKGIKGLRIENKEEAYAYNNAIATQLALICELYLKALYIYENKMSAKTVDVLWNNLKRPNNIASSIPKSASGHHLDILLDNLSLDSKTIIKSRMATLDRNKSGKFSEINIFDILKNHGLIEGGNIYTDEVDKEIESHKNTFINARYGGQLFSKPDIKFLEHLTTQIRVLARYKIAPIKGRTIDITKYEKGYFPREIAELYYKKPEIISEDLISLIGNSEEKKELFKNVVNLKLHERILLDLNSSKLYFLIRFFSFEEIFNIFETEYPSLIVPSFYESLNPNALVLKAKEQDRKNRGFTEFCINLKVMLSTEFPKENIKEILSIYLSSYKKEDEIVIKKY